MTEAPGRQAVGASVRRIARCVVDLQRRARGEAGGLHGCDHRAPVEEVRRRRVVHVGREAVHLERVAHIETCIDGELERLDVGIAPALAEAAKRNDVVADDLAERGGVGSGMAARGDVGLGILGREIREPVGAERQADVPADGQALAVAFVILTVLRGERPALARVLQDDVDDTRDRIRAVLRRGAIAQDLDPLDRRGGERREVHALRALVDRSQRCELQVHEGGAMPARAVHQHQGVIGREVAQRNGADEGGTVRDREALRVQRRGHLWQAIRQIERCLVREQFA